MSLYMSLRDSASVDQVGNKFANLARAATQFQVPQALCISTEVFRLALGGERLMFAQQFFADLRATMGCFLLSSMPTLQEVMGDLALPDALRRSLHDQLIATFGSLGTRAFAVRSSGVTEDTYGFSFAGVYTSKLDVHGFENLCTAIVECWQAYYSYPAIAARIRANDHDHNPAMALIIQEMVSAKFAGVAFTAPELDRPIVIEFVHGLGNGLVSGTVTPQRYIAGDTFHQVTDAAIPVLKKVCSTVGAIKSLFGYETDVEWAWDDCGLHILQVRPVTIQLQPSRESRMPFFRSASLYMDAVLPPDLELGESREIYVTYVSKRAPSYRLAATHGVATGAAHLLSFNGPGLIQHQEAIAQLLLSSPVQRVVLDLSTNIRQVVLDKTEVVEYFQRTFHLTATSYDRHTIIIRDFIQGEYGFISRLIGEHGLIVECSAEGLLNINRGIAHGERILLEDGTQPIIAAQLLGDASPEVIAAFQPVLPQIFAFTRALNQEMSETQLEWVLDSGIPYFVDFSREQHHVIQSQQAGTIAIASGVGHGPIMHLADDTMLYRLSVGPAVSVDKNRDVRDHDGLRALMDAVAVSPQRPIIYARRPYAILSVLFEHVAGFIFHEGATLCHLALLLREAGLPAVICRDLIIHDGDEAMLADGQVTIFRQGELP